MEGRVLPGGDDQPRLRVRQGREQVALSRAQPAVDGAVELLRTDARAAGAAAAGGRGWHRAAVAARRLVGGEARRVARAVRRAARARALAARSAAAAFDRRPGDR